MRWLWRSTVTRPDPAAAAERGCQADRGRAGGAGGRVRVHRRAAGGAAGRPRVQQPCEAGVVLTALIAGTALASLAVGRFADRFGRRRSYAVFFAGSRRGRGGRGRRARCGCCWWSRSPARCRPTWWTTARRPRWSRRCWPPRMPARPRCTAATTRSARPPAPSASLAVILPGLGPHGSGACTRGCSWCWSRSGSAGAVLAARLSPAVEASPAAASPLEPVTRARRGWVRRGRWCGGWPRCSPSMPRAAAWSRPRSCPTSSPSGITRRWRRWAGCSSPSSVVQAVSVALAPLLARRFGLIATMVGTHLPSNVLLAAVAFAPTFRVAAVLLLARTTLSQMDVPTRQALVMTVVTPRRADRRGGGHQRRPLHRAPARAPDRRAGAAGRARGAAACWPARSRPATTWPCGAGRTAAAWPPALRPAAPGSSAEPGRHHLSRGAAMIVCLRTVVVPPEWHDRYLAWIAAGRAIRQQHGILAELVCEPAHARRGQPW